MDKGIYVINSLLLPTWQLKGRSPLSRTPSCFLLS
jgi:hypothetical protein